jgi:hypothetical protein
LQRDAIAKLSARPPLNRGWGYRASRACHGEDRGETLIIGGRCLLKRSFTVAPTPCRHRRHVPLRVLDPSKRRSPGHAFNAGPAGRIARRARARGRFRRALLPDSHDWLMLTRMAQESGMENPTAEDLAHFDRKRKGKTLSNGTKRVRPTPTPGSPR